MAILQVPAQLAVVPQWPNGQVGGLAVALAMGTQAVDSRRNRALFSVARPLTWPFGRCRTAQGPTKRTSSSARGGLGNCLAAGGSRLLPAACGSDRQSPRSPREH